MDKELSYLVPKELEPKISKGSMVRVPLRSSTATGVVMEICDNPPQREEKFSLKRIYALVQPEPVLTQDLIKLSLWMREYYGCGLQAIFESLIPSIV